MHLSFDLKFRVSEPDTGFPVHQDYLDFYPELTLKTGADPLRRVTAGLVIHSVTKRAVTPIDTDLFNYVDVDVPETVEGAHGTWADPPAFFRTHKPTDLESLTSKRLHLHGHSYLPYIPDALSRGAELSPGALFPDEGRVTRLPRRRGELSGHIAVRAAAYLADDNGVIDWYQLVFKYWPVGKRDWEKEVLSASALEPPGRPRVSWGVLPRFL